MRASNKQIRDQLLYLVIALGFVAATVAYALYVPPQSRPDVRWIGLTGATVVTFGYPLRWYRRSLAQLKFWVLFCTFLGIHLLAYVLVLSSVGQWPLILFALITPAEWLVICPVLQRAGGARFSG